MEQRRSKIEGPSCGRVLRPRSVIGTDRADSQIMYSSDISVELLALDALESLIKTLYPKVETSPAGLAHDIIKQCLEMLKDPEKNQAVSATKILGALLRASGKCHRGLELIISFGGSVRIRTSSTATVPTIQQSAVHLSATTSSRRSVRPRCCRPFHVYRSNEVFEF